MKPCPVHLCPVAISERMFVCGRHWRAFSGDSKDRVTWAYKDYLCDLISLSELLRVTAEVVADFDGTRPDERDAVRTVVCRRCGFAALRARTERGAAVDLSIDPAGETIVFGGVAVPLGSFGPQYTRFTQHRCPRQVAAAATTTEGMTCHSTRGSTIRPVSPAA